MLHLSANDSIRPGISKMLSIHHKPKEATWTFNMQDLKAATLSVQEHERIPFKPGTTQACPP